MLRACVLRGYGCVIKPLESLATQNSNKVRLCCISQRDTNFNLSRYYASQVNLENSERIYYGPLTPQIRAVKVFSLSSSMAGLVAQPIIIREAATIGSTSLLVALCSIVGFFTFVTPLLLHFITKKYVIEMHYNPETSTFTATTVTFLLVNRQISFKCEDVHVPEIPGMFTSFNVKGKALFVEPRHFSDPIYYAKLMGYDKPIDFELGENNEKKDSESKN